MHSENKSNLNSAVKKSVSVVIPTYYRHSLLSGILDCLMRQTYKPAEVIVVDQTPKKDRPPNFYDMYKEKLPLEVIDLDTPSSTKSRNIGAKAAKSEILCFFDDKVLGDDDLIESHLKVLDEENVDVVAGAVLHPDRYGDILPKSPQWIKYQEKLDPFMIFLISPNYQWKGMAMGISTANFCISRELYLSLGGMDEEMSGRFDDLEFSYRLFRSGAKMFFSPLPMIRNKRVHFGGAYHKKLGFFGKVFRPAIHPNYLYIHIKHFPGWTTKQLIIKKAIEVYWPSVYWLKHPWNLILFPVKLLRAFWISRGMYRHHLNSIN